MKPYFLFFLMAVQMSPSLASQQILGTITDPKGDDSGAGALIYPQRPDFQPGDLDLLQLQISRADDGFWFEAKFSNAIRSPAGVPNTLGSESLGTFARKGFYQFNVDVYVDMDRIPGSGKTFTLPGRHMKIDPAFAWEKAVVLTPRPELMRQQLIGTTVEQYPDQIKSEIETTIDQSVFFPTRIEVRGKSVRYFVPAKFFNDSDGTDWGLVAFVTGALANITADLSLFPSTKDPLDRIELGVMQPKVGRPDDTFGYSGSAQSPVVDLLASSVDKQVSQLVTKRELTGVAWGMHAVTGVPVPTTTITDENVSTIGTQLKEMIQPDREPADNGVTGAPEKYFSSKTPVAKRLQTLQQLFDQKLINESEYKQQRQRILNEL